MRRALNGAFAFAMVVVCGANPPGCECITDNTAIDFEQRKQLGWSYGTWCAAWDDGVCTPEANGKDWAPKHSCSSENPGKTVRRTQIGDNWTSDTDAVSRRM